MKSEEYLSLSPQNVEVPRLHAYLLSAVAPRPIALCSTVDAEGRPNLAPFSYFNVFSTRPPLLIVGPNRSARTGLNKDTVLNAQETREMTINIVTYNMVEQQNVASGEYPKGVDEFIKSGFTPLPSLVVKPHRVKESPVQLECVVRDVISLGENKGAGNLILCEAVQIHIHPSILNEQGQIDPRLVDQVARMGGNFYCRAHGDALFEVAKPVGLQLVGIDALPPSARNSEILSGNDLGKLANTETLPNPAEAAAYWNLPENAAYRNQSLDEIHRAVKKLIADQKIYEARCLIMAYEN